jgi:tetrahydromethanopterin S-methyltransferase subunit G
MEGQIHTIEDVALLMVETMASKEDIQELEGRVNTRLDGIDSRLDNLDARVGRIEADVHALRDEMVHRREFEDVLDRVTYIEKKLGIESGV